MPMGTSNKSMEIRCTHCKAPVKSVFEGGPHKARFEEKNYSLLTGQYKIDHVYDQVKKIPPKDVKPRVQTKDWLKTMSMVSKISDSQETAHKWSGYTFMTEHEDQKIERAYQEKNVDSTVERAIWKCFNKKRKKHQYIEKTTNAGPEWFQDLSPLQMELIDKFEGNLKSDMKERHSGRSQQFLYDLGIWPEIPPKEAAKCVKASGGNIIPFLFYVHQEIVRIETPEYEKKFTEAAKTKKMISPYSINERILLTSVFHCHYPTLLKKLDKLLPEPYKPPNVLWGKKPPKKKKTYSSPYLEPLPINDKPWYEAWAEEELEKKVLRKIKRDKEKKDRKELVEKMKMKEAKLKQKLEENRKKKWAQNKVAPGSFNMSLFDEEDLANLAALPPRERKSFFFKRYSEVLKNFIEHEEGEVLTPPLVHVPTPEETPSVTSMDSLLLSEDSSLFNEEGEEDNVSELTKDLIEDDEAQTKKRKDLQLRFANSTLLSGLFGSKTDGTYLTRCLQDTEVENISEDIHLIKVPSSLTPKSSSEENLEEKGKNLWVPLDITYKELTSVSRISSQEGVRKMSGPPLPDVTVLQSLKKISKTRISTMDTPYPVECTEPECALVENLEEPLNEFELAKRRISTIAPKKQLGAAIRFLCDKGDPLAILPKMEMVPWLIRWFDKRRGIKRFLTIDDKDELLSRSQSIWNTDYTSPLEAPMVEIPDRSYSWSQKKWLMDLINKRTNNHERAIKHILIDNARDLFPSMFCEYYETGLNKNFKNTFYAYFPARERDCLVVRPWDPNENGEDKQKTVEVE